MSNRIIISATSDIGYALASAWASKGHKIYGTYRTDSNARADLTANGAELVRCDLGNRGSIDTAVEEISARCQSWDVLVIAAGSQSPVGPLLECNMDDWEQSVYVNFISQVRIVISLLKSRTKDPSGMPIIIFFAGGGTNNATKNYSAYTISKVALIKMCELLDAEVIDTRFTILGPGWVKTKIHDATLSLGDKAGDNYWRTLTKLSGDECVPIIKVVECCDWLISCPASIVGGRNFSLVFDEWGSQDLERALETDPDMYKLRRNGNDFLVRPAPICEKNLKVF